MKVRKLFSCFMALLLLMLTLAACDGGVEPSTSSSSGDTASADSQPAEEKDIGDYVEKKDYGGRTLTILSPRMNAENKSETEYMKNEYADNYEGEKLATRINDAIEARNHLVEEYLNVQIVEQRLHETSRPGGAMLQTVRTEIIVGGSTTYQLINPCLYDCGTLAAEGSLYNLYSNSTLNGLEAEWWDHTFNGDVSFGDKLYFTNGDMGFQSKSSTAIVVFNRDLQTEYGLEDPYALVREGTWTIDKAIEMAKNISEDLNGDGQITYEDKVGWEGQADDCWNMFYSSGSRIAEFDADGKLQLTMYTERSARAAERIMELGQDDAHYISANDYFSVTQWPVELCMENFAAGNALFFSDSLGSLINFQKMKGNYGLLPIPKLDEAQDEYQSFINPWVSSALCIPSSLPMEDAEFAGAVLECMGYYSMDTVRREYHDEVLSYQYVQDDESMEMLELILNTRGCDVGQIFQVGNYQNTLHEFATMDPGSFRSAYEASAGAAQEDIDRLNALFEELA